MNLSLFSLDDRFDFMVSLPALKIFAVCFGLRLAFGQYPYAGLSLSLGVIPCRHLPKIF
jgi:hypothetical protein